MVVDVASLDRRSPIALRSFVAAQRMLVRRFPESVEPGSASGDTYWRFLLNRVSLEGICAHYQSYDAHGDENDWNLNIVPDGGYQWLLDPAILFSLSLASGAPAVVDPAEVKTYGGTRAIECELTPDDGLYGKFSTGGLPITSGGWWPDQSANQGEGPTGSRVGVYGAFIGDYGHGGRPEIHPFDAFWRRFHTPRSAAISWDLGVFQDDSNRFNGNWSEAPIDVEFRVPFCVDFPVTTSGSVLRRAVFTLTRSGLCSVVARKTVRASGPAALRETFTGRTVRFNPFAENRLEVSIENLTGIAGSPFRMSLEDVQFTRARLLGILTTGAWLSGSLVIRVAVEQDGFAYWNVAGPNSTTAGDAPDDRRPEIATGELTAIAAAAPPARGPAIVRIIEAKTIVSTGDEPELAAELVVEVEGEGCDPGRRTVAVRPGLEPVIYPNPDDPAGAVALESFDLFAGAGIVGADGPARQVEADVAAAITRLAGLERLGRRLRPVPALLEVDDGITVEFATRYAPFRNGSVAGEEYSLLSEAVTGAVGEPVALSCDVRLTSAAGDSYRLTEQDGRVPAGSRELPEVRTESEGARHWLYVGPLGDDPVVVQVDARFRDGFGRQAANRALVANYRIVDAGAWLEKAAGISRAAIRDSRANAERLAAERPDPGAVAAAGMLGALDTLLSDLAGGGAAPARRVAGVARLAIRVAELVPGAPLR